VGGGSGSGSSYWSWGHDQILHYTYILSSMVGQLRFNSCPILIHITFISFHVDSPPHFVCMRVEKGLLRIRLIKGEGCSTV
jgi:hypothetical protein